MQIVTLVGVVARPEFKQAGQSVVLQFSLGCRQRSKEGTETVWYKVQVWGKRAEALARFVQAKQILTVVGELSAKIWNSEKGPRLDLTVKAHDLNFQSAPIQQEQPTQQAAPIDSSDGYSDEIPF